MSILYLTDLTSAQFQKGQVYKTVTLSNYDATTLNLSPSFYMGVTPKSLPIDLSNNGATITMSTSKPMVYKMTNNDSSFMFDGTSQFLEVASKPQFSIPMTGELTISAWIRPSVLQFPKTEGSGYVHWMGKGTPSKHEYVFRMYSLNNLENRPNRISAYAFNTTGGKGSGAYFEEPVNLMEWMHVVGVYNTKNTSLENPTGYIKIYKNGVLKDSTPLNQYNIIPKSSSAPFRIATRDMNSYFQGAIGKVAVFNKELTNAQIVNIYSSML